MDRTQAEETGIAQTRAQRVRALELGFRQLTCALYDTCIPAAQLEAEVAPRLADDITFVDPWQTGRGKPAYRLGMAGFHAMFRFDLAIKQACVSLDESGKSGRAILDGVMHLDQLEPLFSYPLRTLITYEFTIADPAQPEQFLVHAHEEMWSLGDMIAAVPLLGKFYSRIFRPAFAKGFLAASRIASR